MAKRATPRVIHSLSGFIIKVSKTHLHFIDRCITNIAGKFAARGTFTANLKGDIGRGYMRARGYKGLRDMFEAFAAWAVSAFFHGIKHGVNNVRRSAATLLSICFVLSLGQISQAQDSFDLPPSNAVNEIGIGDGEMPGGPGGGETMLIFSPEYIKRANVSERLTAYDNNLMGDSVDLNTGTLSFQHVDVSLPGNSGLEVAIRRRRAQGDIFKHRAPNASENNDQKISNSFSDWMLEVPNISMTVAAGTLGGINLCLNPEPDNAQVLLDIYVFNQGPQAPNFGEGTVISVPAHQYSSGIFLNMPGSGGQQLVTRPKGVDWPADTRFVTKDNWAIRCGPQGNELSAFTATAPNGTTYRFDQFVRRKEFAMPFDSFTFSGGGGTQANGALPRSNTIAQVSEVIDVNGNWVRYAYNARGWVTRIHSNDGREIRINRNADGLVTSVVTNPTGTSSRTWRYDYQTASNGNIFLEKVTQPDGRYWQFDMERMNSQPPNYWNDCDANDHFTVNLTHPNGTQGTFTLTDRKQVLSAGTDASLLRGCHQTDATLPENRRYGPYYTVYSVIKKELRNSSIPTATWRYNYKPAAYDVTTRNGDDVGGSINPDEIWGEIINPEGERTRNTYWNTEELSGLMKSTEVFAGAGGTALQTTEYDYELEASLGDSWLEDTTNTIPFTTPRHTVKTVTKVNGDTFTSESKFNTFQSRADYSFGRAVETRSYSNVSTEPRIIRTEYEHNKAKWVLGLPKRMGQYDQATGEFREMSTYEYDSRGRKTSQTRYGKPYGRFNYHTNSAFRGALFAITDALGRRVELRDYKAGTPQRIRSAVGTSDETNEYQYVDENGWLTSQVDAAGKTTRYRHDNMGRLTQIDPHSSWDNTNISYSFPSSGGAVQTINKGQARTTVTYDAMFRTRLVRTQALDTGWSSYVNTDYDPLGRVVFTSQPSTSANETKGVTSKYDALGRMTESRETVAPYATTRYRYLNNHRRRVTDPSGAYTDYYSFGWDGPGSEDYRLIYQYAKGGGPFLRRTTLRKNIFGQLTTLQQYGTQGGVTANQYQYFIYDDEQRLCRHHVPEHGSTRYQYDAAGQMVAYAKGQSSASCAVPNSDARVNLSYDNLGRLITTDFRHAATPDITRSYDAVGNLTAITRGSGAQAVEWSYGYNSADLLNAETLRLDGRNFRLRYNYNSAGHMTRRRLPSGRNIDYTPDGLGRVTDVESNGDTLASGTRFHASGAVIAMDYGNGHEFTQTLNARLLPQRGRSAKAGVNPAFDQELTYDARGKITAIRDRAQSINSRTYGYDGLGQLITATGPWGAGGAANATATFKYDSLGNLLNKTLGPRNVIFSYDSRNRLTRSADAGAPDGQSTGTRTVAYDTRGNVTTLGSMGFVYDYSDQPVAVSGSANQSGKVGANGAVGATNGNYRYDGNLKRVKAVVNGKTIYNVYDAGGALVHVDNVSAGEETDYISGPMGALARYKNGTITYLHNDHLGSAQSGTTSTGSVRWRERYSPFGSELIGNAANDNQSGFTGHIKDGATGLNYMQARYYDPVIGRFLSIDPVTFLDSGDRS